MKKAYKIGKILEISNSERNKLAEEWIRIFT